MDNYTGKTLEEALQAAAEAKNVAVDELTYFVTEEKKGLAEFTNSYNKTYKGGGSVTNTITDASQAEQNYAQETGGGKE